jgi:hypothetical protein
MPGLCFYFENTDVDVWSGRDLDAWRYAAKAAGDIDNIIVVNKTDQLLSFGDFDVGFGVVAELPKLPNAKYLVSPLEAVHGATRLWDLDHKGVEWYCFGPAAGWQDMGSIPVDDRLTIPQAGIGSLHSVHIASVVMMHRFAVIGGG